MKSPLGGAVDREDTRAWSDERSWRNHRHGAGNETRRPSGMVTHSITGSERHIT